MNGTWDDNDGAVYVRCRAYDGTAYSGSINDSFANGIDGTVPSITDNQGTYAAYLNERTDKTFDVDFSDSTSGLDMIQARLIGETWYDIASVDDLASYTTDWYVPVGLWNDASDGETIVSARAYDEAGNSISVDSVFTLRKDVTNPTGSIDAIDDQTQPSTISGSASDATTSVNSVDIAIYDSDTGKYWNGAFWSSYGSPYFVDCTGTTSWSYDSSGVDWDSVSGDSITITLRIYDSAGNVDSSADTETFIAKFVWNLDNTFGFTAGNSSSWNLDNTFGFTAGNNSLWYLLDSFGFTGGNSSSWNKDSEFSFTAGNISSWNKNSEFSFTAGIISSWNLLDSFGFSGGNTSSWSLLETFGFTGGNSSS
ncbi:MAG: hypothetical protein R6V12_07350, partial [Candidatus Hydrogenedentota bacterium]